MPLPKFSYVDTAYAKTDDAAKAYYTLGKIYETIQINYTKAVSNYGKAKAEYPASLITADATKKADAFVKYFSLYSDFRRYDSLITVIKSDRIKRDSLALAVDTLNAGKAKRDSLLLAADTLHTNDSSSVLSRGAKTRMALRQLLKSCWRRGIDWRGSIP